MGKVSDGWRNIRGREVVQAFGAVDRELYPEVSELLAGKPGPAGNAWDRPPLTLWVFAEGDVLRWCFSAKEFPMQLWGAVPSLKDLLPAIEDDLCKERCSWRKKHDENNGFTRHR